MAGNRFNDRDLVIEDNTIYEIDSSCYIDINQELRTNNMLESKSNCRKSSVGRRNRNSSLMCIALLLCIIK